MSVTYFSIFSPEIFNVEIKNKFLSERKKLLKLNSKKNIYQEQLSTEETNINNQTKTTYYKTATNFNSLNENIRDIIANKIKSKLKSTKKKPKHILSQVFGEKIPPYKQYLIEKRKLENIKTEKNRFKMLSRNRKELLALPDKTKIKGLNFATQRGFGFFEQYAKSKNYSKDNLNNNRRHVFTVRKSKNNEFDLTLFEDIKANKRKKIFLNENYNTESYLRYNKFRNNVFSFLNFLKESPNYNY